MRQTIFFIPHELPGIPGIPVFGFGWMLGAWVLFAAAWLGWRAWRHGWDAESAGAVPFFGIVALVIAFLLPRLEISGLGLPIRGYGVMLLFGFMAGLGMAARRARQVGLHPDCVYALAFWMFGLGIAGARIFFVIQYWPTFREPTLAGTLGKVMQFTEGGLVVYGSLLGATLGFWLFARRHRLRFLQLGDVIAPGMAMGLAVGRLGCLLNGCCYGGVCDPGTLSIQFPRFSSVVERKMSPPYAAQLSSGQLHGISLEKQAATGNVVVAEVRPESPAAETGLRQGEAVGSLNFRPVASLTDARRILAEAGPELTLISGDGATYHWTIGTLPANSLPVRPAQIYSSINALLLAGFLWFLFPYRTRDGVVLGALLTLYPVSRILLEWIRGDESGQFGTALTISQLVSALILVSMLVYWPRVFAQAKLVPPEVAG